MKDRLSILAETRERPKRLINLYNEIYGACGHKIRLRRYKKCTNSTDDGVNLEREHGGKSEPSTCENSIITDTCGSVSSEKNTNPVLVIRIGIDFDLINSTVLIEEPTDIISPISNDRYCRNTNVASV